MYKTYTDYSIFENDKIICYIIVKKQVNYGLINILTRAKK